jgi:hypothetical protein
MLGALLEGAAGIEDRSNRYRDLRLSPRWAASDVQDVRVVARYGVSDGYVAYTWQRAPQQLVLDLTGTWQRARIRMLLPDDAEDIVAVHVDGRRVAAEMETVGASRYAIVEATGGNAEVHVIWGASGFARNVAMQTFLHMALRAIWPYAGS